MIPHLATSLVHVATTLFAQRGYAATSTREITGVVGVDIAALFYHFKSKPDLLRAVLEPLETGLSGVVKDAEGRRTKADRRSAAVGGLLELQAEQAEVVQVWADPSIRNVPQATAKLTRLDNRLLKTLEGTGPHGRDVARAAVAAVRSYSPESLATDADRKRAHTAVLGLLGA